MIEVDDLNYLVKKMKTIMGNTYTLKEWGIFSRQHITAFSFENIVSTVEDLTNKS